MGRVFFNTRKNIKKLDAAYTVLASDSGTTFVLNAAAGAAITLPAVGTGAAELNEGWNCRIITGLAFATTDWVVTATAAIIAGGINELPAGTVGPYSAAATTITIGFDSEESIGDYIDLVCDGTKIWLSGQSNLDAGYLLA